MMVTLLDYTLRMSVILGIALLAVSILRRQSAALRHLILACGIFCTAALPVFNRALPPLDWTLPAEVPALTASLGQSGFEPLPAPAVPLRSPETEVVPPESAAAPPSVHPTPPYSAPLRVTAVLRWIYFSGAVLSLAVLLLSLFRLGRISAGASVLEHPAWRRVAAETTREYGMGRPVRLLESRSPAVLATWGLFRPRVVVPSGASEWTEERSRIVLGHEFAHIQRSDWLVQFIAEIVRSVFWFNPLVWIAGKRLRQEGEHACDDVVLSRGISASDYATHLLDLARTLGNAEPLWAPALLMARPSTLEQRFHAMLNPRVKRSRVTRPALWFTLSTFLGLALPLAVLRAAVVPGTVTEAVRETAETTANTVRSVVLAVLEPQAAPPAAPIPNSIEGAVVRLGSNDPVSDVDIELRRVEGTPSAPLGPLVMPPGYFGPGAVVRPTYPNPADIVNIRTKSDGKFVFTNLKPGTYRLQAARAGGAYFPAEYGQRNARGKGYDFQFAEGQSMRDVRLTMAPTGSITGRVVDADGQPVARVRVMALEAVYSLGERKFGMIQAVQTDDRGEYRLFWLPPGQYVIAARQEDPRRQSLSLFITPPGSSDGWETYSQAPLTIRTLDNGTVVEETFEMVYYGGDSDMKKARTVDLVAGGSVAGVDLSLAGSRVRTRHVRGTLLDPGGARIPGVTMSALPRSSAPSMVAPTAITDVNGSFDLAGVGLGAYTLRGALPGFAGYAVLGPGDKDVDGLTITMTLGFRLQGKIAAEGRAPGSPSPEVSRLNIRLENVLSGLPAAGSGAINGDSFTVNVPQPGEYRVLVNPILVPYTSDPARRPTIPPDLQNAYVKAIRLNADDGLAGPVNVAAQPGQLEVVIALNGGVLEGAVTDRQQPAPNAVVVLAPAVRVRFDLYRVAASNGNGRFRMQGIPPGEYKLFAWDYVEDGAWYDAGFMRAREGGGKAVRINEGNNAEISLTMGRP